MKYKNRNNDKNIISWNWIVLSIIIFTACALLVSYFPDFREIDTNILIFCRKYLLIYPIAIPNVISSLGADFGILYFWFEFTATSVLIACNQYIKAFLLVFSTHVAYLTNTLIKNFFHRERPARITYPHYSFPSLHATLVTCLFGIFIYLTLKYVRNRFWKYTLVFVYSLFIFSTFISRLWLGVHFLSDIIAGMALGLFFVNIYTILDKFLQQE